MRRVCTTCIATVFQSSAWPDNSSNLLYHRTSWGNLLFYLIIIRSHNVNSWGGKLRIVGVQFPFWPRHIYSKLSHFFPAVHCNHAPFYLCFAFQDIFSEINVLAHLRSMCFKNVQFLKNALANIEEVFTLILSIFYCYDRKIMRKIFSKFLHLRKTCGFEFIVFSFHVAERL